MSRIGLVGAGFISRVHAEALKAISGQTLACVIDPNLPAAQRLARDFGDAHRDLGWTPVSERNIFITRAITAHAGE